MFARTLHRRNGPRQVLLAFSHPIARSMATIRSPAAHEERTATEPRENQVEPVILANIREVNDSIRLLRLNAADPNHTIRFRPGQWVDTFLPGLRQAGGFTITSTPNEARPSSHAPPYIELAVQMSRNPPAQWLWRPAEEILNTQLAVRVGGSFTWPPQCLDPRKIERLVLVAGGVGINPLISIFSHLIRLPTHMRPPEIHFIYSTKSNHDLDAQKILFLPRLMDLTAAAADPHVTLTCFLTGLGDEGVIEHGKLPNRTFGRRFHQEDLVEALDGFKTNVFGPEHDRAGTVAYVCGPPKMTDDIVELLRAQEGMAEERVLCEKWW